MNTTFEGIDESRASFYAVVLAFSAQLALYFAITQLSVLWAAAWLTAVLSLPIAWFGTRYRVDVGRGGIVLSRRCIWYLRTRRERLYLDSRPVVSESFWADEWDDDPGSGGVFLDAREIGEDASDVFGPIWGEAAMVDLRDRLHAAVLAARRQVSGARPLALPGQNASDFEVLEYSPGGVPRIARNRQVVKVHDIAIPVGSTFTLNRDDWVDPARPDRLVCIEVAQTTSLPGGLELAVGGELCFSSLQPTHVTVSSGLPPTVQVAGLRLNGEHITFDSALGFVPIHFQLAARARFGETTLPAGTKIDTSWSLDGMWSARLCGPLSLPDIELAAGDSMHFDARWRLLSLWVNREGVQVRGVALTADFASLPVDRDGRVSLRRCRSLGYLDKAAPHPKS